VSRVYSFSAEIDLKTTEALIAVTFAQIPQGATELHYLFSTPGGQVAQGIALYNTLKALPVPTIMHNVDNVRASRRLLSCSRSFHTASVLSSHTQGTSP
jgi:ATP-dependent protease ClpP protease subunit